MSDQLMSYDTAIMAWAGQVLGPILDTPAPLTVLFAPPSRAFSEPATNLEEKQKRPELPRVTLSRADYIQQPERAGTAKVKVGYTDDTESPSSIKLARHPIPIQIPYQIDLWTRYNWQMNRWLERVFWEFQPLVKNLSVTIDETWGDKWLAMFFDGAVNNTDLEPGDQLRLVRYTVSVNVEAWLFDVTPTVVKTIKTIFLDIFDQDTDDLLATLIYPRN